MIYTKSELQNSLFFEIATKAAPYNKLDKSAILLWETYFHGRYNKDGEFSHPSESYEKHAKFVPEFGHIVSVTLGVVNDDMSIDVVSTETKSEVAVLKEFSESLSQYVKLTPAGYNLTYSIQFLIKRMIVNKVKLPYQLQLRGKKPWEIVMLDIMKDYQGTTFETLKLEVLAKTLGVKFAAYDDENPTESCERYLTTVIECAKAMSL